MATDNLVHWQNWTHPNGHYIMYSLLYPVQQLLLGHVTQRLREFPKILKWFLL